MTPGPGNCHLDHCSQERAWSYYCCHLSPELGHIQAIYSTKYITDTKARALSQQNRRPGARVELPDINALAEWRSFGTGILGQELGHLGNIALPTRTEHFNVLTTSNHTNTYHFPLQTQSLVRKLELHAWLRLINSYPHLGELGYGHFFWAHSHSVSEPKDKIRILPARKNVMREDELAYTINNVCDTHP